MAWMRSPWAAPCWARFEVSAGSTRGSHSWTPGGRDRGWPPSDSPGLLSRVGTPLGCPRSFLSVQVAAFRMSRSSRSTCISRRSHDGSSALLGTAGLPGQALCRTPRTHKLAELRSGCGQQFHVLRQGRHLAATCGSGHRWGSHPPPHPRRSVSRNASHSSGVRPSG